MSSDVQEPPEPAIGVEGARMSMHASARCGARTRDGTPCQSPAVKGKKRCRMHGGAPGSGAPKGNKNAWKHGEYSAEHKATVKKLRKVLRSFTPEDEGLL